MPMRFEWTRSPLGFSTQFQAFIQRKRRELVQLAQFFSARIEAWMKAEAIWTDRTGNARQTLYAEVEANIIQTAIVLGYGVQYGVYLEFSNAGRYAILAPAVDFWQPQINVAVRELLRR